MNLVFIIFILCWVSAYGQPTLNLINCRFFDTWDGNRVVKWFNLSTWDWLEQIMHEVFPINLVLCLLSNDDIPLLVLRRATSLALSCVFGRFGGLVRRSRLFEFDDLSRLLYIFLSLELWNSLQLLINLTLELVDTRREWCMFKLKLLSAFRLLAGGLLHRYLFLQFLIFKCNWNYRSLLLLLFFMLLSTLCWRCHGVWSVW